MLCTVLEYELGVVVHGTNDGEELEADCWTLKLQHKWGTLGVCLLIHCIY